MEEEKMQIMLCKVQKSQEIFTLEEINQFDSTDVRLADLVCPNCDCPLSYYPAGIKKAYLKTRNGEQHTPDCSNYFVSINKELLLQSNGVIKYKMGTDEKRKRALEARKKLFKESDSIETSKAIKRAPVPKRSDKTRVVERAKIQLVRNTDLAEPNVSEDMVKGRVRIPRKLVEEVNYNIVGKTINLIGFLKDVELVNNQATLVIEHNGSILKAVLTEAFFSTVSNNYRDLLHVVKKIVEEGSLVIDVVVSGDVMVDKRGLYLAVFEDDDLYLRGLRTVQLAAAYIHRENGGAA